MITAAAVKELRDMTGAGMMDCKRALTETDGNMEEAVKYLREKGLAAAAKKSDRIAAEGAVGCFVSDDHKLGCIVEINCETDFVAKTPNFQDFLKEIATIIAQNDFADVDALLNFTYNGEPVSNLLKSQIAKIGENMNIRRFEKYVVPADVNGIIDVYIHMGGKIGSMVCLNSGNAQDAANADLITLCRGLAMQVAAARPQFLDRSEVDAATIENEKEVFRVQALNEGKPANIVERMVEGRVNKFLEEVCLVEQDYIRDTSKTVKQHVAEVAKAADTTLSIVKFARFEMGEGLQKREDNFAQEVLGQMK